MRPHWFPFWWALCLIDLSTIKREVEGRDKRKRKWNINEMTNAMKKPESAGTQRWAFIPKSYPQSILPCPFTKHFDIWHKYGTRKHWCGFHVQFVASWFDRERPRKPVQLHKQEALMDMHWVPSGCNIVLTAFSMWQVVMASETMKAPICLVENKNKKLSVNRRAIEILSSISHPVVVVGIVGMYRTGKSYLMNCLAGQNNGACCLGQQPIAWTPYSLGSYCGRVTCRNANLAEEGK